MSFLRRALFLLIAILAACSDREHPNPSPQPNGELIVASSSHAPN